MERTIGMDADAANCKLAVISEKSRKLKDPPVETNGQALVEAIRMLRGHKQLVFEERLQSAWLYETLRPHVDELWVAGITESRGSKSEKRDAYGLAEKLRSAPPRAPARWPQGSSGASASRCPGACAAAPPLQW